MEMFVKWLGFTVLALAPYQWLGMMPLPWFSPAACCAALCRLSCWHPEALHIAFGKGRLALELGWGSKYSGKLCDELAARFNQAIAEMNNGSKGDTPT